MNKYKRMLEWEPFWKKVYWTELYLLYLIQILRVPLHCMFSQHWQSVTSLESALSLASWHPWCWSRQWWITWQSCGSEWYHPGRRCKSSGIILILWYHHSCQSMSHQQGFAPDCERIAICPFLLHEGKNCWTDPILLFSLHLLLVKWPLEYLAPIIFIYIIYM